jgi:thiamine-phosphate pyrophosphorylase
MQRQLRGLYAITPEEPDTGRLLSLARCVLAAGPALLQFRSKDPDANARQRQAAALLVACRAHGVPLIINDDVALAARIGADGVHLGRDDDDPGETRTRLGAGAIIGVSCYDDMSRARHAATAGADYVAFGSMFPTPRKPLAPVAGPALLVEAAGLPVSVCAIGGITLARAPALLAAGADLLAVIGDLFDAEDPGGNAERYVRLFGTRG